MTMKVAQIAVGVVVPIMISKPVPIEQMICPMSMIGNCVRESVAEYINTAYCSRT